MPKPTKGPRLGGGPAHERLMLANLAQSLFEHGAIRTTETRAKRLRPVAERLITKAKRGDLHARRQVMATLSRKDIVHTLFADIAPSMSERQGGYTRITKIGPRKGDNAPMAVIELVTEPVSPKQATVQEAEGATKRAVKEDAAAAAAASEASAESAGSAASPEAAAESAGSPESAESAASPEAAAESAASAEDAEDTKESEDDSK